MLVNGIQPEAINLSKAKAKYEKHHKNFNLNTNAIFLALRFNPFYVHDIDCEALQSKLWLEQLLRNSQKEKYWKTI